MRRAGTWLLAGTAMMAWAGTAAAEGPAFCKGLQQAVAAQPATRGDGPLFVRSYQPGADEAALPLGLSTTAFTYDNALAAIALVACGDVATARRIGDALDHAAASDRTFRDGRLRNAYRAGAAGDGPALLPGWWDNRTQSWGEDAAQDGSSTGNVAWGALALLTLFEETSEPRYLDGARRLMDWILTETLCGDHGFCGGWHGYDPQQVKLTWSSTEHNVDVGAVAAWLARRTGDPRYREAAATARRFVGTSFRSDHFLLGTTPQGQPADPALLALDVQLWPWMADPEAPPAWRRALGFAETHLAVDGGFDFNGDRDGVWVEGTAQAALGYRIAGQTEAAARLLRTLDGDRTPTGLLNATRSAQVTTGLSIDPTQTVPDFLYYKRPHLGATAWAVLAATGWNPFTGRVVR
jgi:hypothetical protein